MIEDIERLRSQLEVYSLGQKELLGESHVGVDQARTKQRVSFNIAKSSGERPTIRSRNLARVGESWHWVEVSHVVSSWIKRSFIQVACGAPANGIGTAERATLTIDILVFRAQAVRGSKG